MDRVTKREILEGQENGPVSFPVALAAASAGIVAGGGISLALAKVFGISQAVAAVWGTVLGGFGVFTTVAYKLRKDTRTTREDWPARGREVGAGDIPPDHPQIAEVVSYLKEHLGTEVTAYASGVEDTGLVERWISGESTPDPLSAGRLRHAKEAARCIVSRFNGETAQSWFFGTNPWLEDEAPVYVLRHNDDPKVWGEVVEAAQDFAELTR